MLSKNVYLVIVIPRSIERDSKFCYDLRKEEEEEKEEEMG
jgi:hypothetical protein